MYTIYTATMANAHWPLAPMANGHWPFLLYKKRIHVTRMGSRPSRAIQLNQRYTALYSIQLYIAIHYTPSTSPLWHVRDGGRRGRRGAGPGVRARLGLHGTRGASTRALSGLAALSASRARGAPRRSPATPRSTSTRHARGTVSQPIKREMGSYEDHKH